MTTPGDLPGVEIPEDVYQPGAGGYGQQHKDLTQETARNYLMLPYQSAFGTSANLLLDALNGILTSVFDAIVTGAQAIGIIATNIWNGLVDAVTGIFEGIASIFTGGGSYEAGSILAEANDRQLEINERLDLMEDVSGYIATYMKENHYKTRDTWHVMPFNGQLGPNKNAELITNGTWANCIWLAKGTWVISVQVAHDQHADRKASIVRLTGYKPDLTVFTTKEGHYEVNPDKKLTLPVQHTVVVPDDAGMYLQVTAKYDVGTLGGIYKKLRYLGGTHMTHFTAHRLNLDTSNAIREEDVPTIGTE